MEACGGCNRRRGRSQCLPTLVLSLLRGIWIDIALQPESKPVYVSLLGFEALHRLLMDVSAIWEVDQIDWFVLNAERGIQLPLLKHRAGIDGFNANGCLHLIEMKTRSLFDPLLQTIAKWACPPYPFHLTAERGPDSEDQILHIAVIEAIGNRRRRKELWVLDESVNRIPTGPTEAHHAHIDYDRPCQPQRDSRLRCGSPPDGFADRLRIKYRPSS